MDLLKRGIVKKEQGAGKYYINDFSPYYKVLCEYFHKEFVDPSIDSWFTPTELYAGIAEQSFRAI
jgi:hypothetical protein